MKRKTLGVLFAALLAPFGASADPAYNYFEVGLINGSYDWADGCTGTTATSYMSGVSVRGSFAIGDNWFVDGSYDGTTINVPDFTCSAFVDFDATDYTIAAGWHGENWYIKAGLETYEYYCCSDDSGYMVDGGYRASLSDALEWNAHLGYASIGDTANALRYGFGVSMLLGDSWGVSMNYDIIDWTDVLGFFDEGSTAVTIKARFQW